jgi:hypothetical protein
MCGGWELGSGMRREDTYIYTTFNDMYNLPELHANVKFPYFELASMI